MNAEGNMMVVVPTSRESDIWLVPTAKPSDARALTTGTAKSDGAVGLSWTPDGKIVYASTASGNRDIWLLDVNKETQKQLTSNARQNYYPQVTPDGRHILFLSDRSEALGIWRMDLDGTNATQLVSGPIQRFTSSGDGKWIIYSGAGPKGMPILWKLAIDGGQPVILNEDYWEEFPTASPDSKQVTFQYMKRGGGAMIGQVSLDGGTINDVAKPPFRFSQAFRWTPDGTAVAYIDNSNGPGQIWALPSTGGPAKQLTNFATDSIFWFDWSRDGKQLAVARGTQLSDVVLISDFR
jgi:Tol biopolymer transport system component